MYVVCEEDTIDDSARCKSVQHVQGEEVTSYSWIWVAIVSAAQTFTDGIHEDRHDHLRFTCEVSSLH